MTQKKVPVFPSPMERPHQPGPSLREFRTGQLTAGEMCSGKVPAVTDSQHQPSLITPPRLKVPTHSDSVKRWNFRKADWKGFCLLTGESVERLLPPDRTQPFNACAGHHYVR